MTTYRRQAYTWHAKKIFFLLKNRNIMETQDEAATVENHNNNSDNDGNRTVLTAWIMTFRDDLE